MYPRNDEETLAEVAEDEYEYRHQGDNVTPMRPRRSRRQRQVRDADDRISKSS